MDTAMLNLIALCTFWTVVVFIALILLHRLYTDVFRKKSRKELESEIKTLEAEFKRHTLRIAELEDRLEQYRLVARINRVKGFLYHKIRLYEPSRYDMGARQYYVERCAEIDSTVPLSEILAEEKRVNILLKKFYKENNL